MRPNGVLSTVIEHLLLNLENSFSSQRGARLNRVIEISDEYSPLNKLRFIIEYISFTLMENNKPKQQVHPFVIETFSIFKRIKHCVTIIRY